MPSLTDDLNITTIRFKETTLPATPPANFVQLYFSAVPALSYVNEDGLVVVLPYTISDEAQHVIAAQVYRR